MATALKPINELDILMDKSSERLGEALAELALVHARQRLTGRRDQQAMRDALFTLGTLLKNSQGFADLLGRKRLVTELADVEKQDFAEITPKKFSLDLAFKVPFKEAMDSILQNKIFNTVGGLGKAQISKEITSVYGDEVPVMNYRGVDEARDAVFQKVNRVLVEDIKSGIPRNEAIDQIRDAVKDWSRGRGEVIYRTQIAKSYTAGRWRQLEQPAIRQRITGIQFVATPDSNVRHDHLALHRKIWAPRDPVWSSISPPIHFNCRCSIRMISASTMRRMGRLDITKKTDQFPQGTPIFDAAPTLPTPRFGDRADKTVYAMF